MGRRKKRWRALPSYPRGEARPPAPTRSRTAARKPALWWSLAKGLFPAILFSLVSLALGDMLRTSWRLRDHGQTTTAEVTGFNEGRRGNSVRYRFEVGGERYTHWDVLRLDEDTHANIGQEASDRARETNTLPVVYWPPDPRINLPADSPPYPGSPGCLGVGFAVMALLAAAGWITAFTELREWRAWRARRRTESLWTGPPPDLPRRARSPAVPVQPPAGVDAPRDAQDGHENPERPSE